MIRIMKAMTRGLAILVVLTMVSCGQKSETAGLKQEPPAIKVKVATVTAATGSTGLRYSGSIEPFRTVPLTFQNMGTIREILVEEGDFVKKGALLARLDDENAKNMHQIALSKYEQAKDAYDRLKTVYDEGSLPEIKWVEMETNLEQAKSSLEIARNNLEKCEMYAPESGVIGRRNAQPGQSSVGVPLAPLELVKIENVYVKISVPENEIGEIESGQEAVFHVAALNGKKYEGKITSVNPVADMISRTYTAKILVENRNYELKPGMVCDVELNTGAANSSPLVTYTAVSADAEGKPYVFVVSPDKKRVRKQNITTGDFFENKIEVTSGLNAGETIVVEGKEKLSDNSLIRL